MELRNLQYFYETARLGNFSKAAETLSISQPALSMGIRNLERELQCPLFKRGRKLRITAQGQILQLHCEKLFTQLSKLREDIFLAGKGVRGVIYAGVLESILLYVFPRIIANFAESCPDVVLRFEKSETSQIEQQIIDNKLDFGIISRVTTSKKLEETFLGSCNHSLVTAASNRHNLATIADQSKLFLLGNWQLEAVKNRTTLFEQFPDIDILHPVNCVAMLRQLVGSGLGMAILPDYVIGDDLRVLETFNELTMSIYLIRQKKRLPNPVVDNFASFIIANFPKTLAGRQ